MSQSIFRKFLLNDTKLNVGFVFVCIFLVFLFFSLIMVGYGSFVYSSYLKIYKERTIHNLAFDVNRIMNDKCIKDNEQAIALSGLFDEYHHDASISEIWVTDREFRLIYDSKADVQRSFSDKKLPSEYFSLYKDGFATAGSGYSATVIDNFSRLETGLALAIKNSPKFALDYTVGMKVNKYNFFITPRLFKIRNNLHINISPVLIFGFFFIVSFGCAMLLILFLLSFFDTFSHNSRAFAAHVAKIADSKDYSPTNVHLPEDTTEIFGPLSHSLNTLFSGTIKFKDDECTEKINQILTDDRVLTHKKIFHSLFPKTIAEVKGCDTAFFSSNFTAQSKNIVLSKENGSFESLFVVASLADRDFDQYILTYNLIRDAFVQWKGKDSLIALNTQLRTNGLPPMKAVSGRLNTAESTLELFYAGFSSFIIYNSKLDEFVLPSQETLDLGKKSDEDLILLMKEERLRLTSGDRVLFFNPDLPGQEISVDTMKKHLTDQSGASAEESLRPLVTEASTAKKNAFLFLIKKK